MIIQIKPNDMLFQRDNLLMVLVDGVTAEAEIFKTSNPDELVINVLNYTATKDPEPEPAWTTGYVVQCAERILWTVYTDNGDVVDSTGQLADISELQRPLVVIAEPKYIFK